MNFPFESLDFDRIAQATLREWTDNALLSFYAFTLVLVRLSGLMTLGPLFGNQAVPINVRVLLVLTLSFLLTPTIHDQCRLGCAGWDTNRDGLLSRNEIPDHLLARYDRIDSDVRTDGDSPVTGTGPLTIDEFCLPARMPETLIDYGWMIAGEFALGLVLGLGVLAVLSGFQLAGQLIDQQTGMALGEVLNPDLDVTGSLTGQLLYLLGVTVFLVMEPLGGHLVMLSTLIETFQTLPIGEAVVSASTIDLLNGVISQSLVLAVQVAAPLLATMSLVELAMGFLGHTVPQINILVIGFPIRVAASLLILAASLSGAGQAIVDTLPVVIESLRTAITSAP